MFSVSRPVIRRGVAVRRQDRRGRFLRVALRFRRGRERRRNRRLGIGARSHGWHVDPEPSARLTSGRYTNGWTGASVAPVAGRRGNGRHVRAMLDRRRAILLENIDRRSPSRTPHAAAYSASRAGRHPSPASWESRNPPPIVDLQDSAASDPFAGFGIVHDGRAGFRFGFDGRAVLDVRGVLRSPSAVRSSVPSRSIAAASGVSASSAVLIFVLSASRCSSQLRHAQIACRVRLWSLVAPVAASSAVFNAVC